METSLIRKPFPIPRYVHYGNFCYYYAYGNTPAEDFLQNANGLKEPDILLLGCGDLRSCFYTIWKNFNSSIPKHFDGVHFVLNDYSAAIIARDVLFLYLCIKMPHKEAVVKKWISAIWAVWFCHELLPDHKLVLVNALQELIKHSKSVIVWSDISNSLCKLVKFTSQDTLTAVRQTWVMWRTEEIGVKSVKQMNADRIAEQTAKIPDVAAAVAGTIMGSVSPLLMRTLPEKTVKLMEAESTNYFQNGSIFAEEVLEIPISRDSTSPNLTFYERKDGTYTMHYGSVPFKCFYHSYQFSQEQMKLLNISTAASGKLLVKTCYFESQPFLSNSVQQFAFWLRSCATTLHQICLGSRTSSPITFTFHCSDAIDFCLQLQNRTITECKIPFDLVYSSNLCDHLALPNLVLAVLPLVKPGGFLFTTSLLYKAVAPTAEEYLRILFGVDLMLLPSLFGVRCINHEGESFSSVVSVQPIPFGFGNLFSCQQWPKLFIWERVNSLPLKHACLLRKYNMAVSLTAAVCNTITPLQVCTKGCRTINHLCSATAMQMLQCFAAQVEDDVKSHLFWEPLYSLLVQQEASRPFLHSLQMMALLHGLHLHLTLDEGTCPMCLSVPVTNYLGQFEVQFSIDAVSKIVSGPLTPNFMIFIHKDTATFRDAPSLQMTSVLDRDIHIIDCLNGVACGDQLSIHFYLPLQFLHDNYSLTVVSYIACQILENDMNIPSIVTTKSLSRCQQMSEITYAFRDTKPSDPAPVTSLGTLKSNVGDGKFHETVISISDPSPKTLSCDSISATEVKVVLGSLKYVISYHYPVDYNSLSIKLSRKQKEITVSASRKAHTFDLEKPLFSVNTSDDFNLLRMPLSDELMKSFCGMQFTKQDQVIMAQCARSINLMPPMINLKESVNILFQSHERFYNIVIAPVDTHALIIVQDRVFDLQHDTPAVDLAFCFLEPSFVVKVAQQWQQITSSGTRMITVDEAELELLKKTLTYFANRTFGKSLSRATGHLQLLERHKITRYFSRAVVYPLFADPDLCTQVMSQLGGSDASSKLNHEWSQNTSENEESQGDRDSCAACGIASTDLKKCGACNKTKYCSVECQKRHWKVHKKMCKSSEQVRTTPEESSSASVPAVSTLTKCTGCEKGSSSLRKCLCYKVAYCSKACQRMDWYRHKTECTALKNK